jgi:hypothetical protein
MVWYMSQRADICRHDFADLFDTNDSWMFPSKFRESTDTELGHLAILLGPIGGGGYVRSLLDPASMVGVTEQELRAMVPNDWQTQPLKKGIGVKFGSPPNSKGQNFGRSGWAEYNMGDAAIPDLLHQGEFVRVSVGGLQYRVAAGGNPVIKNPSVTSIQIIRIGPPGPGLRGGSDIIREIPPP